MARVDGLMNDILRFDCEPAIYNISITASLHSSVYEATANFRTYDPNKIQHLSVSGNTVGEALNNLWQAINDKFNCPHCGEQLGKRVGNDVIG